MHHRLLNSMVAIVALSAAIALTPALASAQRGGRGAPAPPPEPGPFDRMPDGTPDMNGIWRVRGGLGNITPNIVEVGGVAVEGDDRAIPYTPVYAQLRAESDQRMFEEPELHCYMSGVPSHMWRQSYLGAGLVIQHTTDYVVFLHEFQGSRRIVPLDGRDHISEDIKLFMGDGVGHWEGDTLVIETTNNNAITWLDNNGDRHSDALVVTERFTPINQNAWSWEATFTDEKAYTTSWKVAAPMSRGNNPNAEILEFACVEGNTDNLHYTTDSGGTAAPAPSAAPDVFEAPPPPPGGRGGRGGRGN